MNWTTLIVGLLLAHLIGPLGAFLTIAGLAVVANLIIAFCDKPETTE